MSGLQYTEDALVLECIPGRQGIKILSKRKLQKAQGERVRATVGGMDDSTSAHSKDAESKGDH